MRRRPRCRQAQKGRTAWARGHSTGTAGRRRITADGRGRSGSKALERLTPVILLRKPFSGIAPASLRRVSAASPPEAPGPEAWHWPRSQGKPRGRPGEGAAAPFRVWVATDKTIWGNDPAGVCRRQRLTGSGFGTTSPGPDAPVRRAPEARPKPRRGAAEGGRENPARLPEPRPCRRSARRRSCGPGAPDRTALNRIYGQAPRFPDCRRNGGHAPRHEDAKSEPARSRDFLPERVRL
jgi:hypothetical protein